MTALCSTATPSNFRKSTKEFLVETFSFENLSEELQARAPLLSKLLVTLCQNTATGHIKSKDSQQTTVVLIASILLRERNMHMNALQYVLGILLWNGHTSKEVSSKLYQCMHCGLSQ